MLKRITLIALLATTTATTLSGCANSDVYSGDVYTKDRAKQVQTVSYGTILSTRPVKIQADENSLLGTIGGAVVGGLLGSTIGGGTGRDIAAAGGAIAGAVADTRAELASGPAPGQGGDFADRFTLGKVSADGTVVTMVLQPLEGAFVLSDLSSGPVLFATC